jgi:hypothetical protein
VIGDRVAHDLRVGPASPHRHRDRRHETPAAAAAPSPPPGSRTRSSCSFRLSRRAAFCCRRSTKQSGVDLHHHVPATRSAKAACCFALPMAWRSALICLATPGMKFSSPNFAPKSLATSLAVTRASKVSTTGAHLATSSTREWLPAASGENPTVWGSHLLLRAVSIVADVNAIKNGLKRKFLISANWSASIAIRFPSLDFDLRASLSSSIALDRE